MNFSNFFSLFKKKKKLIMTLLVRDEVDIIRYNIDFHLSHGVDFIIATDNGSIDGTRDILQKYADKGVLMLIDEKDQSYSQAEWVNRMGNIAYEKYKAEIIFHCDADEFWLPIRGNLKSELIKSKEEVLVVDVVNVLLEDKNGLEQFPENSVYAIIKPLESLDLMKDSENKNLYIFQYPPKVIFKTNKGLLRINQGNHSIYEEDLRSKQIFSKKSKEILIYHFPIRSKKHFISKIINGGRSYETNKKLGNEVGFHWRRWYESYKHGNIENEYQKLILSKSEVQWLQENGRIEEFSFKKLISN